MGLRRTWTGGPAAEPRVGAGKSSRHSERPRETPEPVADREQPPAPSSIVRGKCIARQVYANTNQDCPVGCLDRAWTTAFAGMARLLLSAHCNVQGEYGTPGSGKNSRLCFVVLGREQNGKRHPRPRSPRQDAIPKRMRNGCHSAAAHHPHPVPDYGFRDSGAGVRDWWTWE